MVYVDLKPIRARMADTPEQSDHTSIKRRITKALKTPPSYQAAQPEALFPFAGYPRENMPAGLPFRLPDYLELVDWSGRIMREDKRGYIPSQTPAILQRLDIEARHWLYLNRHFELPFKKPGGVSIPCSQGLRRIGQKLDAWYSSM